MKTLCLIVFYTCAALAALRSEDWRRLADNKPQARSGAVMAFDQKHGVSVLFGGIIASPQGPANLADTWIWDGQNWTQMTPANSPSARYNGTMFYDQATGVMILFGGATFNGGLIQPHGDTWMWDGDNWTQLSPADSPAPRYDSVSAYDSIHGVGVLYGGFSAGFLSDTWLWTGSNWSPQSPPQSPVGRILPAFAFDAVHGQAVLFGGSNTVGYLDDTWTWDGATWTQQFPGASPSQRYGASMAFDPLYGYSLMFGGINQKGDLADTWEWNGSNWTQETGLASPPPRFQFSMDYDAVRQQVVIFGGTHGTNLGDVYLSDTWGWQ